MKYIEQEYRQLLSEQRYAYERIINNLESHVNWLECELKKYEKDPLEAEIAMLSEQPQVILDGCPGCDARIKELTEENEKLKKEIASLKKTAVKVKAPKKRTRKQVLCVCKDCGTYFYAQRKDAQRCPECKRKHGSELKKAWYKKHNL